ncbi:MAG: 3'-5' exonuclease, partial [bacterium]
VSRVRSLDDVPFNKGKGTWLVLARHRHIVEEAHRVAKEIGVLPKMRARVKFSTIHGSKGMGVDNVVIFPDMTRRTYNSMVDLDPDAEHRVAYVAASRARHTVYLLEQRGKYGYEY